MTTLAVTFPPNQPPERLKEVALATEAAGLPELWLWEDCFAESGMGPAGAVLAWTEQLRVGVGLFPVPLRNVALAAMEIATLARLFPGRLLPGIGHGVLDWMGQAGARVESPLTLLREYGTALRRLLHGEEVTAAGRYISLDRVQLAWPPEPPPLLVGGVGPKTLALAGEIGDGVILTEESTAESVALARRAHEAAGATGDLDIVWFLSVPVTIEADDLAAQVADRVARGATRIAVCGLSPEGPPDGSERLLDLVETIAQVNSR